VRPSVLRWNWMASVSSSSPLTVISAGPSPDDTEICAGAALPVQASQAMHAIATRPIPLRAIPIIERRPAWHPFYDGMILI